MPNEAVETATTGPGGPPPSGDVTGIFARELWDPRVQSKWWLQAASQAIDAWMRSSAFLELMQQGLEMMITAKRLHGGGPIPDVEFAQREKGGPETSQSRSTLAT